MSDDRDDNHEDDYNHGDDDDEMKDNNDDNSDYYHCYDYVDGNECDCYCNNDNYHATIASDDGDGLGEQDTNSDYFIILFGVATQPTYTAWYVALYLIRAVSCPIPDR